jgi:tetratricopeptide (TPR) repeat protein
LVTELALLAQSQGGRVLTGSTAFAEALPYQSIAEAVRSALPLMASSAVDPSRLSALSQLVPELQARGAELPALPPLPTEREQIRLFEALAACLEALATPRPLLLILEDLHWAGVATAAALEFLARRSTQHSLLIVATYRDEETSRVHPLREVRRRLQQEKALAHLSLSRLPLEAVETLVARVPQLVTKPDDLTRRLYLESEGNPFFLGEVIRDLVEAQPAPGAATRIAEGHLPGGVRTAIFARVGRLSAQARSLAEVAAVIGRAFDVELLREVCGWEEGQILDALSELLDRHLTREIGGRSQVDYAFTHHLIQSAIYDAIPESNRKNRHRRVAGVMEELYEKKSEELAAELALHWDRGAEPERAAQRYLKAALHALAVFAVDEAMGHLDRGLELASADGLRSDMYALRADLRSRGGDRIGQRADLDELDRIAQSRSDEELLCDVLRRRILLARTLGERDVESRLIADLKTRAEVNGSLKWQAQALHAEAIHMAFDSRVDDAVEAVTKALELDRQLADVNGQLECICMLAEMAARRGRPAETHAYLREARLCAQSMPNPSMIARSTIAAARAALMREDSGEAIELGRSALEYYRTASDREGEADALHCIAAAAIGLRQFDVAKRHYEEAVEIYRAIGKRRGVATVLMDTSVIESALGLIAQAQDSIAKAVPIFESLNDLRSLTMCALYLSDFKRVSGDAAGAKACAMRALELARTLRLGPLEATALANLGDAERDAGDYAGAIEHLESAVAMLRGLHRPIDYVEVLAGLSLAYLRAGDYASARTAADELLTEQASIETAYRPQFCFWIAAQVYRAVGEAQRSRELLLHAHDTIQKSANAISEPDTRSAFLRLPFNLEVIDAVLRDSWPGT